MTIGSEDEDGQFPGETAATKRIAHLAVRDENQNVSAYLAGSAL
jgi:hypothetical protein